VKIIKLLVAGASATVVVVAASFVSLIWGFMVVALFIIVIFFELERREIEFEEIGDYLKVEVGSYLNNHSFSVGVAFTIIGVVLLTPAFLIKGAAYWYEWQKGISNVLKILQLPFFFTAIPLLGIGLILTNRKRKDRGNAENSWSNTNIEGVRHST
jgi:preprotein translocase subunit SecY